MSDDPYKVEDRPDDLKRAHDLLGHVDEVWDRLNKLSRMRATTGSPAFADGTSWMPGATIAFAHQNIYAGVDHLRAWRSILANRDIPQFAHMTLLRTALEGAAVASWLLEPDTTEERVRRAAIYRLEELRHRREIERTIERRLRDAAELGDSYASDALASGARPEADHYAKHLDAMTAAGVAAERPPSFTSLIEEYGPGAGLYQLTSALAHRREWAMFEVSTELEGAESTGPGTGRKQIQLSTGWALGVTRLTVDATSRALDTLAIYMGVPVKIHLVVDPATTSLVV